ncbi:MAG: ATP-binding protein [Burkholderiales bacterium]
MRASVFLVDPAPGEAIGPAIREHARAAELDVCGFADDAAAVKALGAALSDEDPIAVLIGPDVKNPLALARSIRARWDGHVLFIPREDDLPALSRQLAIAPMIGENWSIAVAGDASLPRLLKNVARASMQRRQLRTTLDRANVRISARESVDPGRYRALYLTDRYFSTFLEQAPEPIIALDARSLVTAWNRGAKQVLGHPASDAVGAPAASLAGWPPSLSAALDTARAGSDPVFVDLTISVAQASRDFQASVSPVRDDHGGYIGATIIMHDVTANARALAAEQQARRQAEQISRMREEFLAMVDGMPQLAWMARADGWIYWYNQRWYEYTGTTPRDMEGWGWQSVHDPRALPAVLEQWKKSIATGEAFEMVFPLRGADGRFGSFLTRVSPLKDAQGRVLQWFGTNTDITAQREAEEALREADRRKDEFLATLAHELRNPLAPIRSAVDIITRAGPLAEPVAAAGAILDRQARHLTRLVDDLLELSRITQAKVQLRKEPMVLQHALADAVAAARPAAEAAGHALEVELPQEPLEAQADVTRVTQIFLNLLNNAIKFTPRGGRIELSAARNGGEVVVRVRDTGIGIPADHLPRLFQMFSQVAPALERTEGGLGIGLALVRGFAELHGGRVEARSEGSGKGSEFVVYLPLVAPRAAAEPPGQSRPAPVAKSKRILVVDDNVDAAATLRRLLELTGHEVREAHDGVEAVDAADEFGPDIVLLDIGMPRMNGYDAAREIRRRTNGRRVRIIALTGWGQNADRQRALEAGFDLHLTKPVDLHVLGEILAGDA